MHGSVDNNAEEDTAASSAHKPQPLEAQALARLLSTFTTLQTLSWTAMRDPPLALKDALPDLHELQELKVSFPSTFTGKWHASLLPHLPPSVTKLSLSALSATGLSQLQQALTLLKGLRHLELVDCSALDDATLAACGQRSVSLEVLSIRRMFGVGKATDKGLKALLEHAPSLRALVLVDFEGRLHKDTWSRIESVASPYFRKLDIAYTEFGFNHHSWFFDHLSSGALSHFLSLVRLTELRLERFVHSDLHATPLLQQSKLPIEPLLLPHPLPAVIGLAILEQPTLQTLCVDLFTLRLDQVQSISLLPNLCRLQVMVDAPLSRMVRTLMSPSTADAFNWKWELTVLS